MKSALIVILGLFFVGNSVSEHISDVDPFSVDDIKIDKSKNRPLYGEVKEVKKAGIQKKKGDQSSDVVNETGSKDEKNKEITVEPSKPIITGPVEQTTINRDEPTVRSVKSAQPGNLMESLDQLAKKGESAVNGVTGENGQKLDQKPKEIDALDDSQKIDEKTNSYVAVPDSILKAVEEKEKPNLRSETAKVTSEDKEESESTDEEVKKEDPIIKSLEGAEKKLNEAFGVVRSKLNSMTKGHKPIKVDCGTTRVRVVCSKKKKGETGSDEEESGKNEDSGKELEGDSKEGDKSEDKEMKESAESDVEETEVSEDEDEE